MGKFFGVVGFAESTQTSPGVFEDVVTKKDYYGDVLRNTRRLESAAQLNDNLNVNTLISIVADEYADKHFFAIRFVKWRGGFWKVSSVDATQRPRLVLTIGGVYNGPTD